MVANIKAEMEKSFDPEICRDLADVCAHRFEKRRQFKNDTLLRINNYFGQRSQEAQANYALIKFESHPRIKSKVLHCKNRFSYGVYVLDNRFEILPQRLSYPHQQPKSRLGRNHKLEVDDLLFQTSDYLPELIPLVMAFGGIGVNYDSCFAKIGFYTGSRWVDELSIDLRPHAKFEDVNAPKMPVMEISSEPTVRLKKSAESDGNSAVS